MLPSNPIPPNCLCEGYICRIIRRYVGLILKEKQMCWTTSAKEIKHNNNNNGRNGWGWISASEDNNFTVCWGVCDSTIFKRGDRPGRSDWYPRVYLHKPSVDQCNPMDQSILQLKDTAIHLLENSKQTGVNTTQNGTTHICEELQ